MYFGIIKCAKHLTFFTWMSVLFHQFLCQTLKMPYKLICGRKKIHFRFLFEILIEMPTILFHLLKDPRSPCAKTLARRKMNEHLTTKFIGSTTFFLSSNIFEKMLIFGNRMTFPTRNKHSKCLLAV